MSDDAAVTSGSRAPDAVDMRILEVLRDDGRISMTALAQAVNLSRAGVYNRVEALRRTGVITGFSARIDARRVGLDICALVFVTVHPQMWESFRGALADMPEVESCTITTGEHDAMLLIRAVDVSGVHDFATGVVGILPEVRAVVSVEHRVLDGDVEELMEQQLHRRWTLHSTSHHLGLDVHDCIHAAAGDYRDGLLEEGMVITVEPGLYFQPDDRLAPRAFRGIGVRIEDDVLVTAQGARTLSSALPRAVADVEAWLAQVTG